MSITARKLIISLLILAQGIILWQGVFASEFSRFDAVDSENIACHQAPHSHSNFHSTQTDDMQDCYCDKCCMGFCHCNHCACSSIFLISSFSISNFPFQIFNFSTFPTYLDKFLSRLFKPPRKFRS